VSRIGNWWASPPRSGMRLMLMPWEYRHLRLCGRVRAVGGVVLVALGVVTRLEGGADWKTYGWALAFLTAGLADLGLARWELRIAGAPSERR